MSIKKFNFNDTIRAIPQKSLSSDVLGQKDIIMLKLIADDIAYTGVGAYAYKYLPVMYLCDEISNGGKEGIVMPKGSIVSYITNQTSIVDGMANPSASGTINQYLSELTSSWITASIDDSYYGYDESITSLLVPANGGAESTIPYSLLDDQTGAYNKNGDSALVIGANIPAGIVIEPIFADIRGRYLNYQSHDAYTPLKKATINVPFVDTNIITSFGSDADIADSAKGYTAVWRKWQFLAFNGNSAPARSGALLKSDKFGKFVIESSATNATKSVQTVGKVLTTDCRFPKDIASMIQTYPGTRLLGANTAGVPSDLFIFAYEVLGAASLSRTATDIVNYIRGGAFGYARISIEL